MSFEGFVPRPTDGVGRVLWRPFQAAENVVRNTVTPVPGDLRREGIVGATMNTAGRTVGNAAKETLRMGVDTVVSGIEGTRRAIGSVLGYAVRIPLKALRNAAIIPLTSPNASQNVASNHPSQNPNGTAMRGAEQRLRWLTDLGREEGLIPPWIPNHQPRA